MASVPRLTHPELEGWSKIKEESGIDAYKKEIPGSDVVAFRGTGVIDAPIAKIATIIADTPRAKEWVDDLEEAREIRRISPLEWIEYDHVGTPFVMKDRDFVVHVQLEVNSGAKRFIESIRSAQDPLAPETSYVRGVIFDSKLAAYSFGDDSKTYVDGQIHADPKGSVPKWIVNMFQSDWAIDTIEAIRKQAAKPDVKVDPAFARAFFQ